MVKHIVSALAAFVLSATVSAQTPPDKVVQPDGTIQLVPVPPAVVLSPYYIDPTMTFRVALDSQWSNKDWNGAIRYGTLAKKGDVVEVRILVQPIPKTKVVDGKTVNLYSVFRSADFVLTWDSTKFEQVQPTISGFGYDTSVMDAGKSGIVAPDRSNGVNEIPIPQDGTMLFHAQTLPVPEKRNPALKPLYYQWNWDGYLWQGAYRLLGTLRFKVKDDYYYPTSQTADFKIVPSIVVNGVETKSQIDGGVVVGSNTQLGEVRNGANAIQFGVGGEYKVSQKLSAPTTKFKVGDIVPVRVLVANETKPQKISSVCSLFGWDTNKLEFMGIDKTGARPSQSNSIYWPLAGRINESAIPKDGNAAHVWLSTLGDKTFIDKENLIVTLNFKVLADFDSTVVSLLQRNDPSLTGIIVLDDCGILGSSVPGLFVTGAQSNATIYGIQAP